MGEMLYVLVMVIGQWDEDRDANVLMVSNGEEELQEIADTIEKKATEGKDELLKYTDNHLGLNFAEDFKYEMETESIYNEFFRGDKFCTYVTCAPMKRV